MSLSETLPAHQAQGVRNCSMFGHVSHGRIKEVTPRNTVKVRFHRPGQKPVVEEFEPALLQVGLG